MVEVRIGKLTGSKMKGETERGTMYHQVHSGGRTGQRCLAAGRREEWSSEQEAPAIIWSLVVFRPVKDGRDPGRRECVPVFHYSHA